MRSRQCRSKPIRSNPETASGVLRVRQPYAGDTADVERALASLAPQTRKLLSAREARPHPARDEKLLVGWNGLAIDAFVVSGEVFHDPDDIAIAKRAAERIWNLAWDAQKGQLSHQIFRGRAQGSAFLEDYALLGRSFLSLYQATGEEIWLQRAHTLADALLRRFDANGDGVLTSSLRRRHVDRCASRRRRRSVSIRDLRRGRSPRATWPRDKRSAVR